MNSSEYLKFQRDYGAIIMNAFPREERYELNSRFRTGLQGEMLNMQTNPENYETTIGFLSIWNFNMTNLRMEAAFTNTFRVHESLRTGR